jgi:hypothetical protein
MHGCSLTKLQFLNSIFVLGSTKMQIEQNSRTTSTALGELEEEDNAEAERECSLMGSEIGEHFMIPTAPRMTWQREDDG